MVRAFITALILTGVTGAHAQAPCRFVVSSSRENLRQLREQWNMLRLVPQSAELESRRLISESDWELELRLGKTRPWMVYGQQTLEDWDLARAWIDEGSLSLADLNVGLLKEIHRRACLRHGFLTYDQRRLALRLNQGEIDAGTYRAAIAQLYSQDQGVRTVSPHPELLGAYRSDPLEDYEHTGEHEFADGQRRLLAWEIQRAKNNPYFEIDQRSLKKLENGLYSGTIRYLKHNEIETAVEYEIGIVKKRLENTRDPLTQLRAILELETALLTIHPFVDGNGRTIRLVSDLLFRSIGLPPPVRSGKWDLFMTIDERVFYTIRAMNAYLELYRNRGVP